MAAGVVYEGQVILGDYPCDISSIVRYRGGFNFAASAIEALGGCEFPPFVPILVNFNRREVGLFNLPDTWDTTTEYCIYSFAYNKFLLEEGTTITAVLRANEVSFTGLNAIRYLTKDKVETEVDIYSTLLTDAAARKSLVTNYPQCTFVW